MFYANVSKFVVPSVSFESPTYIYREHVGPVIPVLVLSNPSSIPIAIPVLAIDGSAIGKCLIFL